MRLQGIIRFFLVNFWIFYNTPWLLAYKFSEQLKPEDVQVSLLTVTRGPDIYMLGGHSLLRIKELKPKGVDLVVNWGVFDFHDPNFFINYALGRLNYRSDAQSTQRTLYLYKKYEKRGVIENILNLTKAQKEKLFLKIDWWLLPENKYYLYHLLFNNCSTKIRDILQEVLGDQFFSQYNEVPGYTFRQMGQKYFMNYLFFAFTAPVLMTSGVDYPIRIWDRFIMPIEMPEILKSSPAFDDLGQVKENEKLLGETKVLVEGQNTPFSNIDYSVYVTLLFSLLILLYLFLKYFSSNTIATRFLGLVIIFMGIFSSFWGIIMCFAWFYTLHDYSYHNINLLIYWPFELLFSFCGLFLVVKGRPFYRQSLLAKLMKWMIYLHIILAVALFFIWKIGYIKQDISVNYKYYLPPVIILWGLILKDGITSNKDS